MGLMKLYNGLLFIANMNNQILITIANKIRTIVCLLHTERTASPNYLSVQHNPISTYEKRVNGKVSHDPSQH